MPSKTVLIEGAIALFGDIENLSQLDVRPDFRPLGLQVAVQGSKGVNRMGIGARVKLYTAGRLGEPAALLGCREIATGYGYASGQPAYAHFGLGKAATADVEVILPHGKGKLTRTSVRANQVLVVKQ